MYVNDENRMARMVVVEYIALIITLLLFMAPLLMVIF